MAERIERHRAERPADWMTVEEPYALEEALDADRPARHGRARLPHALGGERARARRDPERVLEAAASAAAVAAGRPGLTVAISNEVGLGIVPATELGRVYRDLLGSVNRVWVDASAEAHFVVAGRSLPLGRIAP